MNNSDKLQKEEQVRYIYRRSITTKDGRKVYPKDAKAFKIPVTD